MVAEDTPEFSHHIVTIDGLDHFQVFFRRLRGPGPINYWIDYSTDLEQWAPDPSVITSVETSVIDERYEQVTVTDTTPQSMNRIFRAVRAGLPVEP